MREAEREGERCISKQHDFKYEKLCFVSSDVLRATAISTPVWSLCCKRNASPLRFRTPHTARILLLFHFKCLTGKINRQQVLLLLTVCYLTKLYTPIPEMSI